jgi:hypothetical protein
MDFPVSVPGVGLVDRRFVDEDPASGRQGSLIPSAWGNSVTDEILNVIRAAAIEPKENLHDQLLKAIQKLVGGEKNLQMTSQVGAALLPAGAEKDRPDVRDIPEGWLLLRGNGQDPQGYIPEFYDRSVSRGWQKLAAQYWVKVLTDALDARLKELEKAGNWYTVLYPNGTAAAPYVIGPDTTLDVVAPFVGSPIFVEPQILVGGVWADPKWSDYPPSPNSSYGVMATQLNEVGNIRVRTGLNAVATTWRLTGSALPIESNVTSAPFRLRVSKLNK